MQKAATPADAGAHPPVRVGACLRRSWALFWARPAVSLALGAAIVLSLISVCVVIGFVTAPWFLCELSAVQLAEGTGRRVERRRAWLGAAAVLTAAVLLTSSVALLSLLGLSSAPAPAIARGPADFPELQLLSGSALFAGAAALVALVFVLPFLYSALMLIEARTTLGAAALESARLVVRGGTLGHLRLSLTANLLQVAPLIAGLSWVTASDSSMLAMLAALPWLAITVPLGQGMIAAAYLQRRDAVVQTVITRRQGRPPRALLWLWVALVLAPLCSFGTLGASLLRPSRLPRGALPAEVELLANQPLGRGPARVRPRGTALTISATTVEARVAASDGGGVGRLPLRGQGPLERLRVGRARDTYGIELMRGGHSYVGWVDRAGVRLDDDERARMADHIPLWALLAMLLGLLATASLLPPVLTMLAEVRRAYALSQGQPDAAALRLRASALRRATLAAAVLLPLAALSLYGGFGALLGIW